MDNRDDVAFHCRAYLLLQKELFKLKQCSLWGIEVSVVDDNLFQWNVKLTGLKGTIWQDIVLSVSFKFSKFYNEEAPQVKFTAVPFHPNVDFNTGEICLDALDQWDHTKSVSHALVTLQYMLSEPSFDNPVNPEAAQMLKEVPDKYKEIVKEKINVIKTSEESERSSKKNIVIEYEEGHTHQNKNHPNHISKLSYEEYYELWKRTATSKSAKESNNPLLDFFQENVEHNFSDVDIDIEEEMQRQLAQHNMLMYGHFEKEKRSENLIANKKQLLKDLNSNQRGMKSLCVSVPTSPIELAPREEISTVDAEDELSVLEIKNLVEWSQNLPENVQ